MTRISHIDFPRDTLEAIADSQRRTSTPIMPANGRTRSLSWLSAMMTDFDCLHQHIRALEEFYHGSFAYPRPRRDAWVADQPLQDDAHKTFPYSNRLSDVRIADIADHGPDILTDDELARLFLNPFALYDLFDVIDELNPDAWMEILHATGKKRPAPITVVRSKSPNREPRSTAAVMRLWPIAVGLLIALVGGGLFWSSHTIDKPFETLVAQAETRTLPPRGKLDAVPTASIRSDRKGFASMVALFPNDKPEVFPGSSYDPIAVVPGSPSESPPFPPGLMDATSILIVITEQPAGDVIRRSLSGTTFTPDQKSQLQAFLNAKLAANNYHWVAYSYLELGDKR
jgi:hypothetical protein